MFNITTIYLDNFKSFTGEHIFDLPTESGLYFLTGLNRREPKLGSNGAGKSTLLDAIYWCLYGRTLRGLKASEVISWGENGCTVAVTLKVAGDEIVVTRTQSPNSLTIDEHPIAQEELLKRIGINADAFVYSVILPQFGQSFFELKPAEKLALFSQIMELDLWLEKSKTAATLTAEISTEIDRTVLGIESTKEVITTTNNDIKFLSLEEGRYEEQRNGRIKQAKTKLEQLQTGLNALDAREKKLSAMLEFLEKDRTRRTDELKRIRDARDSHNLNCSKLNAERTNLLLKIDDAEEALKSLSGLGATCPTCLQEVDAKHLQAERRVMKQKIAGMREHFTEADKKWREVSRFAVKVSKTAAEFDKVLNDINNEISTTSTKLGVVKERTRSITEQAEQAESDLKEIKDRSNPFARMLTDKKQLLTQQESKLAAAKDRLGVLNAEHESTSYWINGFKRLRLFIIEETLRNLELEVNNALGSLGLVDWQVEFDVERENKSGGVTKGFVVFIKCPSHPEPVRWESWSGGETQRLQLAGDFGLANLIMMQAGLINTIEFYDEPSDHLSDEGLVDLAETLQQRAIDENKRIILVDHRMPDFGDFAGIIVVEKDDRGSRIKKAP